MYKSYSTINEILIHDLTEYKDKPAMRWRVGKDGEELRTYGDLYNDVLRVICLLDSLSDDGSHVALVGPTSYNWLCIYLGVVCSGRVAVPLDALLPAEDVVELVDRSDSVIFFVDDAKKDCVGAAKSGALNAKHIISMSDLWDMAEKASGDSKTEPISSISDSPNPDRTCTIMFTSGTTGKSKGVMLTQRNLAENATCLDMGIKENSVALTVLPIHHAYCLSMDILKGMSLGVCICVNDSLLRMAQNILYFEPEIILMVPMMIETFGKKIKAALNKNAATKLIGPLLMRKKVFGENLHTIYCGGAYLNPDYIDLFAKFGIDLIQGYGMTENAPVIANGYGKHVKRESVGRVIPNSEVRIQDGEIQVRGTSVMQGYYKMPEETAETLVDGWLLTGDLGHLDEDGYLYLTGRKKNLIITKNGENVSPEELENKLSENDLVADVMCRESEGIIEAVIFPDQEAMKAARISDDAIRDNLQNIIDGFNKTVPSYKQIHKLTVRETEFEKTSTRKIKRY